jgi:hypothetical protein
MSSSTQRSWSKSKQESEAGPDGSASLHRYTEGDLPERVMVNSEREMVRKNEESPKEERFTSLQPTYEDSVPPENDWELEQDD